MSGGAAVVVGWGDLLLAAVLVLVAVALSAWQRLGLGRTLLFNAARATVQLLVIGQVLIWVFAADHWGWVLALLALSLTIATFTVLNRQPGGAAARRALAPICALAMLAGAGLTLVWVTEVVLRVQPWYAPRYLIPLFGMIVANAMNGAAIAAERLHSEMVARRGEIEAWLALGEGIGRACAVPVRRALLAAMVPAANALAIVGVVSLPGMMTGQILAGADPAQAVRYQLVVVFMLAGATAITSTIVVLLYRNSFFTAALQLKPMVRG